tara:strand:+ start:2399 stop:2770 length:372 start_codon:yes stop_codon:yes gene_type:complete
MNYLIKNIIFILFSTLALHGCKTQSELAMERGIQYYEWNQFDDAILEFKKVIHSFPSNGDNLSYNQIKLLSQAHHNLSISYSKKGWDKDAQIEAKKAFDLIPSSENRAVMELINNKASNTPLN